MLEERHKALIRDYNNLSEKLELSISSFRAQQDNFAQALSVFNVTEERYKEGVASMTDLLQDEMRMRESQSLRYSLVCNRLLWQKATKALTMPLLSNICHL